MKRRQLREEVFKILFLADFYEDRDELIKQCDIATDNLAEEGIADEDVSAIQTKAIAAFEKLDEIDNFINEKVEGWKTTRMGKVDLTLIRLACYEIQYDEDVPTGVAINEAVELAKLYGTDDSQSFVNGVLSKLAN